MKILVTGSNGFIGKNLCLFLKERQYEVLGFDRNTKESLESLVNKCDFVMHLAGINRPKEESEFNTGNVGLTEELISLLKKSGRKIPLLLSSSIQAERDNPYGRSKKEAEDVVFAYGKETGANVFVFRLDNAFGKWCRPNYNSVVATFCYNSAHGLDIQINDPNASIRFVYIDDICETFISCIDKEGSEDILAIPHFYNVKLGELANYLYTFRDSRNTLDIPHMEGFEKALYSTYLSYLPENEFSYDLNSHVDNRGSFTEFLHTETQGQVSVNISHPGIVKGNHYHHTKNEKFLVVKGEGVIRFRKINETEVIEYHVSDKKLEVVDIPVGYTHNIENTGKEDMVTIMWANETFDPERPDTFYEEV